MSSYTRTSMYAHVYVKETKGNKLSFSVISRTCIEILNNYTRTSTYTSKDRSQGAVVNFLRRERSEGLEF